MEDRQQKDRSSLFKFKELKVYCSTEWLADNKKKYRQVFDRYETAFVYAELSFHNKRFDIDSWEAEIMLKCFSVHRGKKEICSLQFSRKIHKSDHVIYIREGWGNKKEGAFWKKGTYYWEAWIEGTKVGTKYFYIEDTGQAIDPAYNPYLEVQSLKLYEGPYDDVSEDDRTYYTVFGEDETRYIYVDAIFKNIHFQTNWECEIFVKFFNGAKELKGQVIRLVHVKKDDEEVRITAGWGSNIKNSWNAGDYSIEIVFMDHLLASVQFEVDEEYIEGNPKITLPNQANPLILLPDEHANLTFQDVMSKLENLIGLQNVKTQIRNHAQYIQFLQLRKERGFQENEEVNVHSVFIGNPGTGKTTVAQMMGLLYKKMGLLSKGHIHSVDRVDLVGEYIGQTAPKVREALDKARGGVLFIDEAYSLARSNDDSKDFGREVIELLVKEMSNGPGDLAIIVAGYPKEMKYFLDSNPGLKSRFKVNLEFSDYLPQELSQIADYACQEKRVVLTPDAKTKVNEMITEAYRNRDRTFGNARYVYDIIEKAKLNLALRVMAEEDPYQVSDNELETIVVEDVEKISLDLTKSLPLIPVDDQLLQSSLRELDQLIGMENIKKEIRELVNIVKYYRNTGKDVLNNFFLHTVFIGNPGTGKTTVARILAKIYKALGILERGHMIETDRQGLVAGYIGQTAIKTAEKIEDSLGGVLFIDEAYALTMRNSAGGDYGNEAIQTILKRMEDHRGEFFVFVAGYPENMESFLKANPGLRSRFDKILKFEDYLPEQLVEIADLMFSEHQLELAGNARNFIKQYFEIMYQRRDKYFGNARTARSIVSEAIRQQNLRLASYKRPPKNSHVVNLEDVKKISLLDEEQIFNKKRIGFSK